MRTLHTAWGLCLFPVPFFYLFMQFRFKEKSTERERSPILPQVLVAGDNTPQQSTPVRSASSMSLASSPGDNHVCVGGEPGSLADAASGIDKVVGTPSSEGRGDIGEDDIGIDSTFDSPFEGNMRDPPFIPITPEMRKIGELRGSNTPFLTSAAQLEGLISEINKTSQCKTEGCNGELRLKKGGACWYGRGRQSIVYLLRM